MVSDEDSALKQENGKIKNGKHEDILSFQKIQTPIKEIFKEITKTIFLSPNQQKVLKGPKKTINFWCCWNW
jgi:hypothetical protein